MKPRKPDYENNINIARRVKINQMQRNVRRSQMGLKRLRALVRILMFGLLIFAAYKVYKLPQWYLEKNAFSSVNNGSLEIIGNKITPMYKIVSVLRQTPVPQRPIYLFDTKQIEKDIEKLEPVKNVYIRRFWFPARIDLIIEERKPILSISPAENVAPIAFFAEGGKLIGREYLPLDDSYKTILVLTYGTKGDDYRNWSEEKINKIYMLAKTIEYYSDEEVKYLDFRNPKDIYVQLPDVKIRLGEMNSTVNNRVKNISSILPEVRTMEQKVKYIDLQWENAQFIKLEE